MVLGVDLGFGQVKSWGDRGGFCFASVVGNPPAYELENSHDDKSLVVEDNGVVYYVGERAVNFTDNGRLTLRADKTNSETDRVKFLAVLGHSGGGRFNVVTGLPVFEFKALRAQLKSNMEQVFRFRYAGKDTLAVVEQVLVIPQAAGAYYDAILDENGAIQDKELASGSVLVIDPGFRTTDVVTMRAGEYVSTGAFTISAGVSKVHQEMKKRLHQAFNLIKKPHEVDQYVRQRYVTLGNTRIGLDQLIEESVYPVAMEIMEELDQNVPDFRELQGVILCGGGSYLFEPFFREHYGSMLHVLSQPEFANARGYFKYGQVI